MHLYSSFEKMYRRIFSIKELEEQIVVQWMFGAVLLFFFATFMRWIASPLITVETAERGAAVCWPYFQNCWQWYFLHAVPFGYSQTILYMAFYGLMLMIVYYMWQKMWVEAHLLMLPLFLWKVFVTFFLSYLIAGPYDYYHIILTAILLFVPFKEYFLKLAFVFLYFMSVTVKFDATWILGTYFTAMKTQLPIFPALLTPFLTNLVIFMQIIGSWFLLSRRQLLQKLALVYSVAFHLYSGILVDYVYPTIALPPILILFGPQYRWSPPPFSKKSIAGWVVIALVALFQLLGFVVPGDRRMSMEGNRFGMFMFEANHQCVVTTKTYTSTNDMASSTRSIMQCSGKYCMTQEKKYREHGLSVIERRYESASAWHRCDPYEWYAKLHLQCERNSAFARIALVFDHSINGGPFYRIVDEPNVCDLTYKPFVRNDWIRLPPEAPAVGLPLQNYFQI